MVELSPELQAALGTAPRRSHWIHRNLIGSE